MIIWMWYFYKLEQPQPLLDNDLQLTKTITDKVIGILQTWLPTLLETFIAVQMREKEEESSQKFEYDTLANYNRSNFL